MGLFKIFKRLTRRGRKRKKAKKASAALEKQQRNRKLNPTSEEHGSTSSKVVNSSASNKASAKSSVSSSVEPRSVQSGAVQSKSSSVSSNQQNSSSVGNSRSGSATVSSSSRGSSSVSAGSSSASFSLRSSNSVSGSSSSESLRSSQSRSVASQSVSSKQASQKLPKSSVPRHLKTKVNHHQDTTRIYSHGLAKSRSNLGQKLNRLFANFRSVNEEFFDDLEDTLIEADVGFNLAVKLTDELRSEVKLRNVKSRSAVQNVIIKKLIDLYDQGGKKEDNRIHFANHGPTVFLFVGVNGAGKTTTIGKMAHMYHQQGKKVLLAAADTFRAGAIEQLDDWAKADDVDIVKKPAHSDPSSVVYDAVHKAKRENYDILFVDTAGRLQNKVNLMNQLAKMKRVLTRVIPQAPHEVILVLDATTGQNALSQAKLFKKVTNVTGIILTKLDGTAKGGIVLAIRNDLHLPVKYVGLGEHVDDLAPFRASNFVYGLFKGLFK